MVAVAENPHVTALPELRLVREVEAVDGSLPSEKRAGVNLADFDEVAVVVTLLNGATAADVEPHFWSDAKEGSPANGGFVPPSPAATLSVTASGQRFVYRVAHHGAVFFQVTSITGGAGKRVRVEVGGVPVYNRMG